MFITIFDGLGIQEYLFGSNRLAENIGASYLVESALTHWPLMAARQTAPDQVNPGTNEVFVTPGILNGSSHKIELLYSAGGNAVFLVQDRPTAMSLAQTYSRILIEQAPGLQIACCHHEITKEPFELGAELLKALRELARIKNTRIASTPLLGLGVTQLCASGTCDPAIGSDPKRPGRFIGPAALAKLNNIDLANRRLQQFPGDAVTNTREFPLELDEIVKELGEKSYIGIVHIDGNGVGKRFQNLLTTSTSNEEQLRSIRHFSAGVTKAGTEAIRAVITQVESLYGHLGSNTKLPIRPLVYGGDDITFVCHGRDALDLAAVCLKKFMESHGDLDACAGIALVKSHYPFWRAYSATEELCRNAKDARRNMGETQCSAMDWQIIPGGPNLSLQRRRDREYKALDGNKLGCRPYFVYPASQDSLHDWNRFHDGLLRTLQTEEPWVKSRSRIKGLIPFLQQGEDATRIILTDMARKGYRIPSYSSESFSESGFYGNRTPLFDAIELLDLTKPL